MPAEVQPPAVEGTCSRCGWAQDTCKWCGEQNATETLAVSPSVNLHRLVDAIVEAAAEQPRNDEWVEKHEVRALGRKEPEVIGTSVHPNSVLTLGEVKKAIKSADLDALLRTEVEMPLCERCAESIAEIGADSVP